MLYRKVKTKKKIEYILDNLRPEDLHEVIESRGVDFKQNFLKELFERKDYFVIGCTKNQNIPAVMGGIVDMGQGIGVVWMLSTPEITKHQICLLKNLKLEINKFDQKYWLTYNFMHKENYIAKNWLKKFGYRFPSSEINKTVIDKNILKSVNVPENYEIFYRLRETRGLN
ncbi:MAG: hypothetical protein PHV37_09020 [Candidatus Gastranaerophilales bacterium]|nr:hypothetical protein [Candidatus Gastranaerophilales bacterium]